MSDFSINSILNLISSAFTISRPPIEPLPPQIILTGAPLRPGLSALEIASNIISRQSKAGRQVGDIFADGQNCEETMEAIRVEAIIDAILNDAVVNIAIPPGIFVETKGIGNLGAPVVTFGSTISTARGLGIIR